MMRSMYSGVSGLRTHQTKMDVIGNNIANVNTVGFKKSQVTFQELFSQTLRGAGAPQAGRGGTNPQQIGLGANVAAMSVVHSQGSTQMTNNKTDLMIDGNGYFILSSDGNGQNRYYTRAGNFSEDEQGYLVAPNGYKLLDENMKPIQINKSVTKAATPTSLIELKGNVDFNDTGYTTTVDVYDSLGDVHTLTINFGPSVTNETEGSIATDASYRRITISDESGNPLGEEYIKFNAQGNYEGISDTLGGAIGFSTTLALNVEGTTDISIALDDEVFQDANGNPLLTNQVNTSDAKGVKVNGNSAGTINDYTIAANGEISGIFTNGEQLTLARIGLADFDNPAGLLKMGNNLFKDTSNSGTAKYGPPSTGSFGELNPMALEMSNVDLSQEFTDMITTQRGFQANSRIITTTDEMLQELVNLKR